MKKWILIGIVAFVVIIGAVLFLGVQNVGPIIKNAVNTYAPNITKTAVSLGDVKVSLLSGEAKLTDFHLGNPKGFKSPSAMEVGSIRVDVDVKSLASDTIIIDRIEVISPKITYEKKRGTDNFKTILNNINKSIGSGKSSKKSAQKETPSKKSTNILIRNFIIKDGKVSLVMPLLSGKGITAHLPDIHLKNIGKGKKGASPEEVFKEVFSELYGKITSRAVADTFNRGLKDLGVGTKEVSEKAQKGVEAVTEKFKSLFGK